MFFDRSYTLAIASSTIIVAISIAAIGQETQKANSSGQWKSATSRSSTVVRPADSSESEMSTVVDRANGNKTQSRELPIRQSSYTPLSLDHDQVLPNGGAKPPVPMSALSPVPPMPSSPSVDRYPGGSVVLRIPFSGNGLVGESVTAEDAFRVYYEHRNVEGPPTFERAFPDGTPDLLANNLVVELRFRYLNPGAYWIVFSKIKDLAGGEMPAGAAGSFKPDDETGVSKSFIVPAGHERGDQVEYPRFLQPGDKQSEFDPGDRVDTRVLQLYYFRDARLVAEYINRNIRDLNQAGYDEAQRFAQQARETADVMIDERRFKETQAIESARKTRETEHQIQETRESLEQSYRALDALDSEKQQIDVGLQQFGGDVTALKTSIVATHGELDALHSQIDAERTKIESVPGLQAEVARLTPLAANRNLDADENASLTAALAKARADLQIAQQADPQDLEAKLEHEENLRNKLLTQQTVLRRSTLNSTQRSRVDAQRKTLEEQLKSDGLPKDLLKEQATEITDRNAVVQAESHELRAAQEQFRREVAAGMADRNSYAKGEVTSIDPVTQVTISVVGTSRLQVRGPIKGVNKIARMVHQLDSPVGQVKVGIHTIQVNGEHGDRMDFVYERINQEVAHSRFLVNTSGQLLRRAVHEVASEVARAADQGYLPDNCPPDLTTGVATLNGTVQTTQDQRDRRYLYAFFGSDFISELEEMDSELLNTENKMLSLHSMDTISLPGALFVMAHADDPVRERIVMRFQELLSGELPQRETEYVHALTHVTVKGKSLQNRFRQATRIDNKNDAEIYFNAARTYHFPNTISYFNDQVAGQGTMNPVQYSTVKLGQALKAQLVAEMELKNYVQERSLLETKSGDTAQKYNESMSDAAAKAKSTAEIANAASQALADVIIQTVKTGFSAYEIMTDEELKNVAIEMINQGKATLASMEKNAKSPAIASQLITDAVQILNSPQDDEEAFKRQLLDKVWVAFDVSKLRADNDVLRNVLGDDVLRNDVGVSGEIRHFRFQVRELINAKQAEAKAIEVMEVREQDLFSQRLLDQFIDEQEEKSVELMEALRSHSSNVDNYLKRLAIAVEDDVAAQFYEPAFQRIRRVSRTWDVTLGQIETTTVLTNNRTLAKVSPAASFEFDLPQRDILLTEALNGSKALANEYGNLLKDGTFLAGTAMLSGQPAMGIVGSNAPIQGIPGQQQHEEFGSELQKLIPDPAIYKFETGTGFEIRPIIQPDGHSIVYGFDYMYSTNVREPVRADEKHLGRIKRHFVHTDVQTSSYELREISRYTVALKASRTDRGVPLLEDLPGVGAAFRPLPSEESSLQTNIILGSSTIYPTVFDLMGLRWSGYVDQLSSPTLAIEKESQSRRREEVRSQLLNNTREKVNKRIQLLVPHQPKVNHVAPGFSSNSNLSQ